MLKRIKKFAFEHHFTYVIYKCLSGGDKTEGVSIENRGKARMTKDIQGSGHSIIIEEGSVLNGVKIRMRGHNNSIIFSEGCSVGEECSFWIEGNNSKIIIGAGTTFTLSCHLNAQEDEVSIIVGKDCMFSNNVIVRTSDSHPIYSLTSHERINPAQDVIIGDHVCIAPNTKIMKGANIGEGSIVGSDTTINKEVPPNVMIAGRPAKIVKTDVQWTREVLF